MNAVSRPWTSLLLCTLLGLAVAACTGDITSQAQADQGLPATCQANVPDPHACDPADTSKTTLCHVPPGNPANAHTICIGNAAVPAHLQHHQGDFVGTCSCPPGTGSGSGSGGSGSGGSGSGSGSGSGGGTGGGTGTGGGSGSGTGGGGAIF